MTHQRIPRTTVPARSPDAAAGRYAAVHRLASSPVVRPAVLPAALPVPRAGSGGARRTAVLVGDELVRRGLLAVLGAEATLQVLPEPWCPADLRRVAAAGLADVVVLDLTSAGDSGAAILEIRAVKRDQPELRVLLLAHDLSDDDVMSAVCGGVDALVSRRSPVEDLVAVVDQVLAGEPTLDRHFASAVVRALRCQATTRGSTLSSREREVLGLVALGQRNGDVARNLYISESTVKFHLRNITDKLGASSRAEVVSLAVRLGLA